MEDWMTFIIKDSISQKKWNTLITHHMYSYVFVGNTPNQLNNETDISRHSLYLLCTGQSNGSIVTTK